MTESKTPRSRPSQRPLEPAPRAVSPEAAIERDPQTGQARHDRSLSDGDSASLSSGGADSAPHTGENAKR